MTSNAALHRAREQFDAVVGPHAGLGRLPQDYGDSFDEGTEFCRECGVVLEACDSPPMCCQCEEVESNG